MKIQFGSKELCKCLEGLKFKSGKQHGSSHIKYSLPANKKVHSGIRPFIIVILGKKAYDPHTISSYIRQIKNLGYTEEEVIACLNK